MNISSNHSLIRVCRGTMARQSGAVPVTSGNVLPLRCQRGVALLVALLLLVIIALVGLAAIRATVMQRHMAGNQYDRELAFQSAEAVLVAGQNHIAAHGEPANIRRCRPGDPPCPDYPGDAYFHDAATDIAAHFWRDNLRADGHSLQYAIDDMGQWHDYSVSNGASHRADANQYGAGNSSGMVHYYRITARSGHPGQAGDHAVVILQEIFRR